MSLMLRQKMLSHEEKLLMRQEIRIRKKHLSGKRLILFLAAVLFAAFRFGPKLIQLINVALKAAVVS